MRKKPRKISPELKKQIITASFAPDCILSELAKLYDVSRGTLHKWRHDHKKLCVNSSTEAGNRFIELSVHDKERTMPKKASLEKASLVFSDFSLSVEGRFKSSQIIEILKVLEESPC